MQCIRSSKRWRSPKNLADASRSGSLNSTRRSTSLPGPAQFRARDPNASSLRTSNSRHTASATCLTSSIVMADMMPSETCLCKQRVRLRLKRGVSGNGTGNGSAPERCTFRSAKARVEPKLRTPERLFAFRAFRVFRGFSLRTCCLIAACRRGAIDIRICWMRMTQ